MPAPPSPQDVFGEELSALEASSGKKVLLLQSLMVRQEDEDEDDDREFTLEELRSIPKMLVTQFCLDKLNAISKETDKVGVGDSDESSDEEGGGGFRIRMTNTASSLKMYHIFDKHYKAASALKRRGELGKAFEYALALLMVFQDDECWYMDTEDEDVAASVARRIIKLLKELFQSHDDAALGLSAGSRGLTIRLADLFRESLANNGVISIRVPALPR